MMVDKFGFRGTYGIDVGSSVMAYQENKKDYEKSQCFNNAFMCLTNNMRTYKNNFYVIGYVLSTDGVNKAAVRHAWNIINGIPVDVTMFANDENPISVLYYTYLPCAVYTNEEAVDAIEKNNNLPALPKTDKEKRIIRSLKRKGFMVME